MRYEEKKAGWAGLTQKPLVNIHYDITVKERASAFTAAILYRPFRFAIFGAFGVDDCVGAAGHAYTRSFISPNLSMLPFTMLFISRRSHDD